MTYRSISLLGISLFLLACSGPGYYLQAISGQWKLMHEREDVQTLLDDPATRSDLLNDLNIAEQILGFANDSLGLPANGSYSSYVELENDALVWNVIATEEFSLQARKWCFLFAGCLPYRGFFDQHKAEKSALRLRNKGEDVIVSPAGAYSTLGWFSDPLLSSMFSSSDTRLAAYLFHELAHQRLYLKDDGQFNESYASFVEEAGVRAWLKFNDRNDELQAWQQIQLVKKEFSELVGDLTVELGGIYSSGVANPAKRQLKADAFQSFTHSYEQLSEHHWHGKKYYSNWFRTPLNNARLALYGTYEGSHCAFQGLLDDAGGAMHVFHHLAEQQSRMTKSQRQQWMMQPCKIIASEPDM